MTTIPRDHSLPTPCIRCGQTFGDTTMLADHIVSFDITNRRCLTDTQMSDGKDGKTWRLRDGVWLTPAMADTYDAGLIGNRTEGVA